jgi:hypothetical protein
MPRFPNSGYSANQSPGVFLRAQGSHSPMIEPEIFLPEDTSHPFLVILLKVSNVWHFQVVPGTINSLVPTLDGTALDSTPAPTKSLGGAPGYVYIECKYTSGQSFPVPADLKVMYDTTVPTDTDTMAYINLAYIDFSGTNPKKTSQNVLTSLYGERLKCGTNPAEYFFTRS